MRLFTGIDLPEEVHDKLERFLAHLRPTAHLNWSPVYNLHITTKFIGEWPEGDLDKLTGALRGIQGISPVSIAIREVGWFPNPDHPRVFWAGIHANEALADLANRTEDVLDPLGIAREKRAFSPHLTLARIRHPVPLQAMRKAIEKFESFEFGSVETDRFYLYLSRPGSAGTVYTKMSTFRLANA
jgi:2'-5' RNA ligase